MVYVVPGCKSSRPSALLVHPSLVVIPMILTLNWLFSISLFVDSFGTLNKRYSTLELPRRLLYGIVLYTLKDYYNRQLQMCFTTLLNILWPVRSNFSFTSSLAFYDPTFLGSTFFTSIFRNHSILYSKLIFFVLFVKSLYWSRVYTE